MHTLRKLTGTEQYKSRTRRKLDTRQQPKQQNNYPELVASYDTRSENEVGLFDQF